MRPTLSKVVLIAYLLALCAANSLLSSLKTFEIVHPVGLDAHSRGQFSTVIGKVNGVPIHAKETTLSFTAEGRTFNLRLQLNENLFTKDFQHVIYDENDQVVRREGLDKIEHCHYQGHVDGEENSYAAISTCGGSFTGRIFSKGMTYSLETAESQHVFFRADQITTEGKCGVDHSHEINAAKPEAIHSRASCSARTLEVGMAYDTKFVTRFSNPTTEVGALINSVSTIYVNGGFSPALSVTVKLIVAYPREATNTAADVALNDFCSWKGTNFPGADMVHLISGQTVFGSSTLGVNYVGVACRTDFYGCGISAYSSSRLITSTTVAHELGHGLGSNHDSGATGTACDGRAHVMGPAVSYTSPANTWSSCSKASIEPSLCGWTCLADGNPSPPASPSPSPAPSLIDQTAFLNRHNWHRQNTFPADYPPASQLSTVVWDATLAAKAQSWADGCKKLEASPASYRQDIAAGENDGFVYDTSSTATQLATNMVNQWAAGVTNYKYNTNTGSGYYTQIVWSATTKIGCGVKACSDAQGQFKQIVCFYNPAGNIVSQRPYVSTNPACKTCSSLNVECGTANPLCDVSSINCGTCTAGKTCNNGKCVCVPTSDCTNKCGTISNGCGGTVTCPSCGAGKLCDNTNKCVCAPLTKAAACGTKKCGTASDSCGGTINCGDCAQGEICDAIGQCQCQTNCPCNTNFCSQNSYECGSHTDPACGQNQNCGSCAPGTQVCVSGKCVCDPKPDCAAIECGVASVGDGCGGSSACPVKTCAGNQNCVNNKCVACTPRTCADNGINCLPGQGFSGNDLDDGCGGTLDCSNVPSCPLSADDVPQTCFKAPNVNHYECYPCAPQNADTCESLGYTDCGTVDNGCKIFTCGPQANNGACPAAGTTCTNGKCVCSLPRTTCALAGRECGDFYDGCELVKCTHSNAAAGSDCPTGQTCGSEGKCVASCTPKECAAGQCGFIDDGCGKLIQCGDTCPKGQVCNAGTCIATDGCTQTCHTFATCVAGTCQCSAGYFGDGVISCTEDTPFIPDLGSWVEFDGDGADWRIEGGGIIYTGSDSSTLVWSATEDDLTNLRQTSQAAGTAGLTCTLSEISANAGLGMRIDADGNGFHWLLNADGSAVIVLVTPTKTYTSKATTKWTASATGANEVKVLFRDNKEKKLVQAFLTVNNAKIGGFQFANKFLPAVGAVYITADAPTSFSNCFLVTRTTVQITLAKCIDQAAFIKYVSDIAKVPQDSIEIEEYDCTSRSARELVATVTFSSTASSSSEAIATQFSSSVSQGLNPQAAVGGLSSAQPISYVTPLVAGLATIGAAALSAGAIAGIAIAGAAVVAGASFGIAVGVKHSQYKKDVIKEVTAPVEMEASKPAPPPRSNVRRTIYRMFNKQGVNIDVDSRTPEDHLSITARSRPN